MPKHAYNAHPLLSNKEWLEEQYVQQDKSCQQIADELGVWLQTVWNWLKRHGIQARPRGYSERFYGRTGRYVDSHGYVYVWQPDHPHGHKGFVREHRLVVEKRLGRYLRSNEIVHHKNRNRQDNKDENLEVHTSHSAHRNAHVLPARPQLLLLRDRDWLAAQLDASKSFVGIAAELGCTQVAVLKWARKHGLKSHRTNQWS